MFTNTLGEVPASTKTQVEELIAKIRKTRLDLVNRAKEAEITVSTIRAGQVILQKKYDDLAASDISEKARLQSAIDTGNEIIRYILTELEKASLEV